MKKLLTYLFPTPCLHCNAKLDDPWALLCPSCQNTLHLPLSVGRCKKCFSHKEDLLCEVCLHAKSPFSKSAMVFEEGDSAARALARYLAKNRYPYVAHLVLSYLFLQLEKLGWEWPDTVIAPPFFKVRSFGKWGKKIEDQNVLMLFLDETLDSMSIKGWPVRAKFPKNLYGLTFFMRASTPVLIQNPRKRYCTA